MSLPQQPIPPVPAATTHIAQFAFPGGNVYMQMRDELGSLYEDALFANLYAVEGQPAVHPWRLALVSVMQFAENLSDRQAAAAVRARIDWKYALSLDLGDSGLHYSVLSEFRARLLEGGLEQILLRAAAGTLKASWLAQSTRSPTDRLHACGGSSQSPPISLNWWAKRCAMRGVLLATVAPDWLKQQAKPDWYERYGERIEDYRLPKDKTERERLSTVIGEDGYFLLDCIEQAQDLAWLKQLPAVQVFAQVWEPQYRRDQGHVQRLTPKEMLPVGEWIRSPYDPEVRYGKKRDFDWVGYKAHLTECCDDQLPRLITQVETVPAIEQDHHALAAMQADLAAKDLLPSQHLGDAGYVSAKRILHSLDTHAIDLIGPVHSDPSWQARTPGARDVSQVHIDWERKPATCPQGQQSSAWYFAQDAKGESIVQILCAKQSCQTCPVRERCTDARTSGRSMIVRYPPERHQMLQRARLRHQTEAFKILYRERAGIEGTCSQTTRNTGLRRSRYIGIQKTHLQHILSAVATNILRLGQWRSGVPFAKTRTSRFAALAA